MARTAVTPTRAENFPEWYQNVIKAADMAENAPVRGCMIIKPYGFAVWENIQKHFDKMIKAEEVRNAYFPLLIPMSYIAKEADHIEGFAKECAIVTHHRLSKNEQGVLGPDKNAVLAEPMIIRPTSETIIGESMHNWVQSYRDLPLKLNQWCNVMRWEMRPRIFLRTTEFLWQEGHNAFATAEEGDNDARRMLEVYADFIENYLAVPVIKGVKTPDERFPGAVETYTVEAFMQDGKALQSATSHNLGQTFSTSSNIRFLDKDGSQKLAWTTSWGMSTRTIGGLIMTHADDDGMVMPPRVAPFQVAILPVIHDEKDRDTILAFCQQLRLDLLSQNVSSEVDKSDLRTSDKMWGTIKKGVPIRVEIGLREMSEGRITYVRRDLGKEGKVQVGLQEMPVQIAAALEQMQVDMLQKARGRLDRMIKEVDSLEALRAFFVAERVGGVKIDMAAIQADSLGFEAIQKEFSVTTRCMPFADNGQKVIVAKAY